MENENLKNEATEIMLNMEYLREDLRDTIIDFHTYIQTHPKH